MIKQKSQSRPARFSGSRDHAPELLAHLTCNGTIDRRMRSVGIARDHGIAGVGGLANRHVEGHLAQERHAPPLRFAPRPTMAENIRARAAVGTLEVAHVLDDAEYRHVYLPEHGKAPPRI